MVEWLWINNNNPLVYDKYSFEKGGISPKFLIIDDGWQTVGMDPNSVELEAKADNSAKWVLKIISFPLYRYFSPRFFGY